MPLHSKLSPQNSELPAAPGTYALLIGVEAPLVIRAGRLGEISLDAGRYVYIGSAHGPGGLAARVERHLRREKRLHWHIDALTAAAPVVEVWWVETVERLECAWARALLTLPGVSVPARGFGSSDCACPAHLLRAPDPAAARDLSRTLERFIEVERKGIRDCEKLKKSTRRLREGLLALFCETMIYDSLKHIAILKFLQVTLRERQKSKARQAK